MGMDALCSVFIAFCIVAETACKVNLWMHIFSKMMLKALLTVSTDFLELLIRPE